MSKPFHELTEAEFKALVKAGNMTWGKCAEIHPQPSWCEYPGAVNGEMGCWSLMDFLIAGPESCTECELFRKKANNKPLSKSVARRLHVQQEGDLDNLDI